MKPLVTIITASYNYAKYISKTMDSVINQTYNNWEYLIIDDGSKDDSLDIIKNYCSKNEKIKLLTHPNNENRGLVETLVLGIGQAKGEYIVFVESDDFIAEDYIEKKLVFFMQNPEVKLICNPVNLVFDKTPSENFIRYIDNVNKYWTTHSVPHRLNYVISLFNCIPTFSCVMLKTSLIKECDFNSPKPAWLDWFLWGQIANEMVYNYPEKLTYFRIHNDSYINLDLSIRDYLSTYNFYKEFYKIIPIPDDILNVIKFRIKQILRLIKYKFLIIENEVFRRK